MPVSIYEAWDNWCSQSVSYSDDSFTDRKESAFIVYFQVVNFIFFSEYYTVYKQIFFAFNLRTHLIYSLIIACLYPATSLCL